MALIGSPVLTRTLLARLDEAFAGTPRAIEGGDRTVVTFPAWHHDVGDLSIEVFGDELVVSVGRFTHLHFEDHEPGDAEDAAAARLVDEVVAFVRDVFADRIEFYGGRFGGGCRQRGGAPRGWFSRLLFGRRAYVWSGPLDGEGDK
jgi:hypothetical protein